METKWASRGDTIETTVMNPVPGKLTARLDTPEACAFGNELIASGRWKLHEWCDNPKCSICVERNKPDEGQ